jgi:hypothetical protein
MQSSTLENKEQNKEPMIQLIVRKLILKPNSDNISIFETQACL